jgi:hypothetical protein
MKGSRNPLLLKNAALHYAPENELGVVFLFASVAGKLQFRVERIRGGYPDCIAYRYAGDREKRVRIEFEFKSSNFRLHRHKTKHCDCIVCWHDDWPDAPQRIEVIELKRYFGAQFKVWIQAALKSQWDYLDGSDQLTWGLSKRVTPGDLLLMYRTYPNSCITDLFCYVGNRLQHGEAGWRRGDAYFGKIERVCTLAAPIFLDDMRRHRILRSAPFVRANMQGKAALLVSEYWPYLHGMMYERNPRARRVLRAYAPEKLGG